MRSRSKAILDGGGLRISINLDNQNSLLHKAKVIKSKEEVL
jgi:hypothetical protein